MKTELRLKPHGIVAERMVTEVWYDGEKIAEVLGLEGRAGVAVVSTHRLAIKRPYPKSQPHVIQIGVKPNGNGHS